MRAHLGPARWTGIAVGAVVLLFWPAPTLRVLIWIVALVALYLGALEWLMNRAPATARRVRGRRGRRSRRRAGVRRGPYRGGPGRPP